MKNEIQFPPFYPELRAALSEELIGNRFQALRRLRRLLTLYPSSTEIMGHIAWISYQQGNLPEALRLLTEILVREPGNLPAAEVCFAAAVENCDPGKAREAVSLLPPEKKPDAEQTVLELEKNLRNREMSPDDATFFGNLVSDRFSAEDEDSLRELERLYNRYPAVPEVGIEYAKTLLQNPGRDIHQRERRALIVFRWFWERTGDLRCAKWVTDLAYRLKDYPTALKAIQDVLPIAGSEATATLAALAGLCYEQMGRYHEAIVWYERALERNPGRIGLRINLICLYEETVSRAKASELKRSLLEDPRAHPFLEVLGSRAPREERETRGKKKKSSPFSQVHHSIAAFFRSTRSPSDKMARIARTAKKNTGLRFVPCNLCGSRRFRGEAICSGNGWPIMRCEDCGLVQVNPQPSQERLTEKYQEGYYDLISVRTVHETPDIGGEPVFMFGRTLDWLESLDLSEFEQTFGTERRLLDVGCGNGFWLRDFRNRGWDCEGTEVSLPVVRYLRELGYTVHEGTLAELNLPRNHYHMVSLNHVIEHVLDPLTELQRIFDLLDRGGLLFVATPGTDSFPSRLAGEDWYYDPDHTFFFSRNTLGSMLKKTGYQILGDASYVGAGHETDDRTWFREFLGPTVANRVAEANQGDVLLFLARKP